MMIQSDFHIFQRDWNHQPYIYIYKYESYGYNMDNNMDNILFTIYYGYTIYNVI